MNSFWFGFYLGGMLITILGSIIAIAEGKIKAASRKETIATYIAFPFVFVLWPIVFPIYMGVRIVGEFKKPKLETPQASEDVAATILEALVIDKDEERVVPSNVRCIKCGAFYDFDLPVCPGCGFKLSSFHKFTK